jgi:hypothetical protein
MARSFLRPIDWIIYTSEAFNRDLQQHDDAQSHFGQATESINLCLGNNWISRGGSHAWPPCSPDFALLYFNLWDYLKKSV